MEDMGCVLHTSSLASIPSKEDPEDIANTSEISEELRDNNTRKQGSSSDTGQGSNPAFVSATDLKIFQEDIRKELATQANTQAEMMKQLDAIQELLMELISKKP
ncbi:hypothetical protein A2U01_0010645 [Trifolium medium]|uniref:Uncharacterized protein n=1 Tax=Trifolium medium TaxID=97028 RepID=A0A392MTY3_9FABA|nr:hypothetical protein [Trifolium medium]